MFCPVCEILLWMTPSEAPKALQTSECSELLDPCASEGFSAQARRKHGASSAQGHGSKEEGRQAGKEEMRSPRQNCG